MATWDLASACCEMARTYRSRDPRPLRETGIRDGDGDGSPAGELRQELLALTGAEAADAPVQNDAGALHGSGGAGRADAGQRADDLGAARPPGYVVVAGEHVGEREGARLQACQPGRSGGALLACLLQRCLALVGGHARELHRAFLAVGRPR